MKMGNLSYRMKPTLFLICNEAYFYDFEDSAATVSDEEKIHGYRNYLGLMKRDLNSTFTKNGHTISRSLNKDKK